MTFIYNRILPASLLAQLREPVGELILKANRESNPENRHRLLPRAIGVVHVEIWT